MPTKVLVFESDSAFAGELRDELGHLGCTTTVVDDGNVGLQQAASDKPDLILLSIELPRMNGFSVCNKLKKDPGLKDVPLIIMSSESSDETFEQHKKLRTRAEDYVHKPIAFGELLNHIQSFVPIGGQTAEADGAIVIDDEIEVGSTDYVLEEEDEASDATRPLSRPPARALETVDADIDAFAESAFGRLTGADAGGPAADAHALRNGSASASASAAASASASVSVETGPSLPVPPSRRSTAPPATRPVSVRPPPVPAGVDAGEHQKLRDELARAKAAAEATERERDDARREIEKLRLQVGEAEQLAHEVEELKAKLLQSSKAGGVSSREFLDLREALNRKDKEILALKEQLSRKDRDIVEAQDKALALERGQADLDGRLLGLERELAEAREKGEALAAETEAAKKATEDLKLRLEKTKGETEGKERQLAELRGRVADERAAAESRLGALRAELDQTLANERAAQARAIDEVEQRRRADLAEAAREREAAVAEANEAADRDREAALEALRSEHAEKLAAVQNDRDARVAAAEAKSARELGEAYDTIARFEVELSAARGELDSLREAKKASDAAVETKVADLEGRLAEARSARDELDAALAEKGRRAAALESEASGLRQELEDVKAKLAAESARADKARTKWEADRQSLERAKDALAVALAQIEEAEGRPGE